MSANKIHSTADVQCEFIGDDTVVWQYSVILKGAKIGNNCNINAHCFLENDVIIGDNVTIKCGVYIWDGIRIGNDVFIGPNVTFTNDMFPRSKKYPSFFISTKIEEGVSIGAGSVIIAGITIGKYAMIGAGSVVTKNVEPYTLCYGNPAGMKKYVCSCGKILDESLTCLSCGKKYFKTPLGLEDIR